MIKPYIRKDHEQSDGLRTIPTSESKRPGTMLSPVFLTFCILLVALVFMARMLHKTISTVPISAENKSAVKGTEDIGNLEDGKFAAISLAEKVIDSEANRNNSKVKPSYLEVLVRISFDGEAINTNPTEAQLRQGVQSFFNNSDLTPKNITQKNMAEYLRYVVTSGTGQYEKRINYGSTSFAYYSQLDERWRNRGYGGKQTIGEAGCGAFAAANLMSALQMETQPMDIVDWAVKNKYTVDSKGSLRTVVTNYMKSRGVNGTRIQAPHNQNLATALKNGKFACAVLRKGDFTDNGHFIIMYGLKDGKINVIDSASWENTTKSWNFDDVYSQIDSDIYVYSTSSLN